MRPFNHSDCGDKSGHQYGNYKLDFYFSFENNDLQCS